MILVSEREEKKMLIKDTRSTIKKFKDVGVGSIIRFVDDDGIWGDDGYLMKSTYIVIMKCHGENGDHYNLVCLDDGNLYYAKNEEDVEILNAELIIKR